eukprot:6212354-Pleurochrysis_carterae.AAC.1
MVSCPVIRVQVFEAAPKRVVRAKRSSSNATGFGMVWTHANSGKNQWCWLISAFDDRTFRHRDRAPHQSPNRRSVTAIELKTPCSAKFDAGETHTTAACLNAIQTESSHTLRFNMFSPP